MSLAEIRDPKKSFYPARKPRPLPINHQEVAMREAMADPNLIAELAESKAHWYTVRVIPGQERVAAAHLIGRRFGCYVPEERIKARVHRGPQTVVKVTRRPYFPGYVFVFAWDLRRNWNRILACPGVHSILLDGAENAAVIADKLVDVFQAMEASSEFPHKLEERKKGWRKVKRTEMPETFGAVIRPYSLGEQLARDALEAKGEIPEQCRESLLHKALLTRSSG